MRNLKPNETSQVKGGHDAGDKEVREVAVLVCGGEDKVETANKHGFVCKG